MPSASPAIACGWSAVGVKTGSSLNSGISPTVAALLEAELARVREAVCALRVEHPVHVGTGFGEGDRIHRQPAAGGAGMRDPAVDVGQARVVGGQRQHLVAVVMVEQVAQVVAAVGDVDAGGRK